MQNDRPSQENESNSQEPLFQSILNRLDRIEERLGLQIPIPPVQEPRPAAPYVPPPVFVSLPSFATPQKDPSASHLPAAPKSADEAEFQFGSVVLPRVGAGLILLGIAYLVGLSISRGWITPWHQFFGAIALCLAAIGIGAWKRKERFEFGQVLIGMGSCGLYLACAVGHAFHNLFSGEVLVAQFLAISFLNLLYGAAAPSRSFVGIGLFGGLAAALLPMREDHALTSLALNLSIALPAAAIIAWHKWREMAIASWMLTIAAVSAPVFLSPSNDLLMVAGLYTLSLAGMLAYARSHQDWEFDPPANFLPFAAIVSGILGLAKLGGPPAVWHELAFGGAIAACALAFRASRARTALGFSGLLTAFLLAPLGLNGTEAAWAYLSLALLASLASFRYRPLICLSFAGLGLSLGVALYAFQVVGPSPVPVGEELGLLALALAVLGAGSWSAGRFTGQSELATFLGLTGAAPLIGRFAAVALGDSQWALSPALSVLSAMILLAAAAGSLALRKSWILLNFYAWSALLVALLLYIGETQRAPLGMGYEMTLLTALLAVAALCGTGTGRLAKNDGGLVLAAVLGWGLFSRMVFLVVTQPSLGMGHNASLTLGWTLYALALMAIGFLTDCRALRITSLALIGATLGKVLLIDLATLDSAVRVVLLLLLGGGMIAGGYVYIRRAKTLGGPPAGVDGMVR